MPSLKPVFDSATFHGSLRLRIDGTDQPLLRASISSLVIQRAPAEPPWGLFHFNYNSGEGDAPSPDLGHSLASMPIGAAVELAMDAESGRAVVFAGVVVARGLDASEGGAPRTWIRCETVQVAALVERGPLTVLVYGGQIMSFVLDECDEAVAIDEPDGSGLRRCHRGTLEVEGWLSVAPDEAVDLRNVGVLFEGPMRVISARIELTGKSLSTRTAVHRVVES